MAKRFTDTEIWTKEWFLDLSVVQKLLVKFLFDNCDCAGIYEPNYRILSFMLGEKVAESDILSLPKIKKLENGKFFITNFIKFQYGVEIENLNPKFSVHKGVILKLNKNNVLATLSQPLEKTIKTLTKTLQDKDMVMDKDNILSSIEEEKEIKKEKEEKNISAIFETYKENCKDLLPLTFEEKDLPLRQDIINFLELIDDNLEYFKSLCIKANKQKFIVNRQIDIKSLITNHVRINNGFYSQTKDERSSEEPKEEKQAITYVNPIIRCKHPEKIQGNSITDKNGIVKGYSVPKDTSELALRASLAQQIVGTSLDDWEIIGYG